MEYMFDNTTKVEEILNFFDGETQNIITISPDTDIENIHLLLTQISELSDYGFRFFNVRFKSLSSEKKSEILKIAIKEQLCIVSLIETMVLLINSSNNYNQEFFNSPNVFFSSVVDYLDVCDALEDEINEIRQKIIYYFLATIKSYVNHPRFIMNESSNFETMPQMYEYILVLLDFFNISFIMNTPNINVPNFSEIPNNIKTNTKLIDFWSDKQKFVISTLSELSNTINKKLEKETTQE